MKTKPTVAVVGMGLIGGSLGMALKKNRWAGRVLGVGRNNSRLSLAKKLKACDAVSTDLSILRQADIIVLATPISVMGRLIHDMVPFLREDAVVTDAGSAKA